MSSESRTRPVRILAIDPGREKCGYALVEMAGTECRLLKKGVKLPTDIVPLWRAESRPGLVLVVGSGTGSRPILLALEDAGATCERVSEAHSTRRARKRYFLDYPPRGWRRLLPISWLTPPVPVDDYAAFILAEEWAASARCGEG